MSIVPTLYKFSCVRMSPHFRVLLEFWAWLPLTLLVGLSGLRHNGSSLMQSTDLEPTPLQGSRPANSHCLGFQASSVSPLRGTPGLPNPLPAPQLETLG